MRILTISSLVLVLAAGCADSPQTIQNNQNRERMCQFSGGPELQARAAFDLHCQQPAIECTVLQRVGMFAIAVTAGVRGCGLQASYVRGGAAGGAWILNGPVEQIGPPPPEQVAPPLPQQ